MPGNILRKVRRGKGTNGTSSSMGVPPRSPPSCSIADSWLLPIARCMDIMTLILAYSRPQMLPAIE